MGNMRKKEGEKLERSINVKIDKKTHEDLKKIAKELGLSMSDIIRIPLLKKYKEVIKNNGWHPENFVK